MRHVKRDRYDRHLLTHMRGVHGASPREDAVANTDVHERKEGQESCCGSGFLLRHRR